MESEINKGGINWGHVSVDRRSSGVEVWARLSPEVEELIKSSSEGGGTYTNGIESFGRNWVGIAPSKDLKVYSLERSLDTATYTLGGICGPLKDSKNRVNLSFLTIVGIGQPNGVRLLMKGPAQAEQVIEFGRGVQKSINYFLREYLIPVHIGINIIVSEEIRNNIRG